MKLPLSAGTRNGNREFPKQLVSALPGEPMMQACATKGLRSVRKAVENTEEAQVAVPVSELTSSDKSAEKAASSRLRAYLGERLKAYYERLEQMPASERMQHLLEQLERQMEGGNPAANEADPALPQSGH
jgi:deoxyribodipyrimidine photolyase